jgi:hypothetical protein
MGWLYLVLLARRTLLTRRNDPLTPLSQSSAKNYRVRANHPCHDLTRTTAGQARTHSRRSRRAFMPQLLYGGIFLGAKRKVRCTDSSSPPPITAMPCQQNGAQILHIRYFSGAASHSYHIRAIALKKRRRKKKKKVHKLHETSLLRL